MRLAAGMLADAADVHAGKLYVHGGGWDSIAATNFPVAHPTMALVLLLAVDYSEALEPGELRVQLVDGDGNDMGVGAGGMMAAGHPPLSKRGAEIFAPLALPFVGLTFHKPDRYEFRVLWNTAPIGAVPFRVMTPPRPSTPGPASIPGEG